ncbi:MAG: hypothetical protein GY731_12975, partial [Gammaproteobacteria bacterium]|nr:hypothetical protein [Gammaproteobacteria bacterium]
HAEGRLHFDNDLAEDNHPLDLSDIRDRCDRRIDQQTCYQILAERGLEYGPSFRPIQSLRFNESEALARLQLPDALSREAGLYSLHPVLLDGALQSVMGLMAGHAESYVPFAMGELELHSPLQPECYAYVKTNPQTEGKMPRMQIEIIDNQGYPLVSIRHFTLRAVKATGSAEEQAEKLEQTAESTPPQDLVYFEAYWKETPLESTQGESDIPADSPLLLINADPGLAAALNAGRNSWKMVENSDQFEVMEEGYRLDLTQPEQNSELLELMQQEGSLPRAIVLQLPEHFPMEDSAPWRAALMPLF